MARRQMNIPGTEPVEIVEISEAGEEWRDARKEKKAAAEREKQKKFSLIALMHAHKVEKYKYTEQDTDEEVLLTVELEPKLRAKKTGEHEPEIGEGLPQHAGPSTNADGVPEGLIAQAMAAQDDANGVEVTSDGDVVVPDKAAPKAKKRGGSKPKKAKS
jgi:hypothetical protein